MNPRSIQFRLTLWHATLLTLVFVMLGALMFTRLRSYLEGNLLDTQSRRARQIAETLLPNVGQTGESYVASQIQVLYSPETGDRFIRVTRRDGHLVYVSGPPVSQSFDPAEVALVSWSPEREFARKQILPDGRSLLIAAVRQTANNGSSYLIEVGTSALSIETMLNRLLLLLGTGLPVVVLVAAVGGYFLVKRALSPVEKMAGKAELITLHNLSERLPVSRSGDEIERLAVSLNHMITRLADAFQNSKRFVADASHELRTPLTVLRGELEHIAQDKQLSSHHRDQLGSLLEETERLSKIVERLLALSRLDAGEAQMEWVAFDLGQLVVTTADQMSLLAEDKKISISHSSAPHVPVMGDRVRLREVVVNLLDNAIKYTPNGGAIHFKVQADHGRAVLEVADTGIGIPVEAVPRVFERFYRVDQARSGEPGGAGLGLAIVKSICAAHGAEVQVESVPGKGSRFRVSLPLAVVELSKAELKNENGN